MLNPKEVLPASNKNLKNREERRGIKTKNMEKLHFVLYPISLDPDQLLVTFWTLNVNQISFALGRCLGEIPSRYYQEVKITQKFTGKLWIIKELCK